MTDRSAPLAPQCVAETLGTFLLVFFGCGAVHAAVLTGAQSGLWQVAIVWGVSIMLAVYVVGHISGAHINPAITVALIAWDRFPAARGAPYIASQFLGAFLAAAALFGLFSGHLAEREHIKGTKRGLPGSELTAMCYCEYFPNPGPFATGDKPLIATEYAHYRTLVSEPQAVAAEVLGTAILALVVFALTDARNQAAPLARLAPVFIGLAVAALISVIAPLTQACFNPARDFGPRLLAWLAGWKQIAFPGPNGYGCLTVYLLAPVVGAVLGGGLYEKLLRPWLPPAAGKETEA